jgi:hypothetical protein
MTRIFSVIRRRPGIVDVLTPRVAGVEGYRFKASANFDGVFVTIFTAPKFGFLDTTGVDQRVIEAQPTDGQVRMVFNPTTYALTDGNQFWLELFHVDGAGVETQVSAPTLVLPDQTQFLSRGYGHIILHGDAPSAVTVAGSLQLDLPRILCDWRVLNEEGATSAYIAFEPGGPEFTLLPNSTTPQFSTFTARSASVWVRGGGAAATLSIEATVANPI